MKQSKTQALFQPSAPNQLSLLLPSLDELINANHPVRVVDTVVDKLKISQLEASASERHSRCRLWK